MRLVRSLLISPLKGTMCAPRKKIVIELDGRQHLEQEEYDKDRTNYLETQGYKVLRFWNHDVMNNIEEVIRHIQYRLEEKS